jgi:hypothetical protein
MPSSAQNMGSKLFEEVVDASSSVQLFCGLV